MKQTSFILQRLPAPHLGSFRSKNKPRLQPEHPRRVDIGERRERDRSSGDGH